MIGRTRTARATQRPTHWRMLTLALAPIVVLNTFATAHADTRVDSKTYDGSVVADCGRTVVERPSGNKTEVCFDIESGDETLDLIVTDATGLPVVALVYFEDDDNNFVNSRGYAEHVLCGRGDAGGASQGPLIDPENPRLPEQKQLPYFNHEPLFSVPPGATKVLILLGDSYFYDSYPGWACLLAGRPGHWGSTGTIEAIFDGG